MQSDNRESDNATKRLIVLPVCPGDPLIWDQPATLRPPAATGLAAAARDVGRVRQKNARPGGAPRVSASARALPHACVLYDLSRNFKKSRKHKADILGVGR